MTTQAPPPGGQKVSVKRTVLAAPNLADPTRTITQIEYQLGILPPRFLYVPTKEWSDAREKELIRADIAKVMSAPSTLISL